MNQPTQPNWIDRLVAFVNPVAAANRLVARELLASYRGGLSTRMDRRVGTSAGAVGASHPLRSAVLTQLRDRARSLEQNNVLASSLLDRATENVIGSGLRLQVRTTDQAFNAAVEKRFEKWADESDIRDLQSFYDIQQLMYRSRLRDGDVGCALVDRGGFPVLQPIEGDQIKARADKPNQRLYDGIQWNNRGRAQQFFIEVYDGARYDYTPVSPRDFVFLMRQSRFTQYRGEPIFAQTFWLFDHVDGYVEAVVSAARAGACQALLIKKNHPGTPYGNMAATATDSAGNTRKALRLEPLSVHYLDVNEEVQGFNPTQPMQQFGDFIATLARLMGLNLGLTLEQVMLDFSRTNYSSSRAARLQADATANVERDKFRRRFLRRLYPWWLEKMIARGEVPTPNGDDYWAHEWVGDARPWVDPEKELKAALIELDMGLTTLAILAKERGREFVELVQQRQEEIKTARRAGVPVVMSNQTREVGEAAPEEPAPAVGGADEDADEEAEGQPEEDDTDEQ